jgi:hypothetical protein
VPSWKRIIVGDAFKLPNKNPRFYIDIALVFPIVFALLALSHPIWSSPPLAWNGREEVIGAAVLLACFLLAKERAVTFGAALGYMFCAGLLHLPLAPSSELWILLVMTLAAGAGVLAIVILNARRTEFYKPTNSFIDRIVVAAAVAGALIFLFKILWDVSRFYSRL